MKHLDQALKIMDCSLITEFEDVYDMWSWHPGMG